MSFACENEVLVKFSSFYILVNTHVFAIENFSYKEDMCSMLVLIKCQQRLGGGDKYVTLVVILH